MTRFFHTTIAFFLLTAAGIAQPTVPLDWTKTDCANGTEHNLFSVLNNGTVVIQEYVMMNCAPCIAAGNVIKNILSQYENSHPGKFHGYQTVYENTTTCATMNNWALTNNFNTTTLFVQGANEVAYYGGMGMPTTVVLGGGNQHKVYYIHQGSISAAAEQNKLKAAIDSALAESFGTGMANVRSISTLNVYPNPASESITIKITDNATDVQLVLSDVTGREILRVATDSPVVRLDVRDVAKGLYNISLMKGTRTLAQARFVKE